MSKMLRSRREIVQWLGMFGGFSALSRSDSKSNQAPSYDDDEAYRVYSTLIPNDWVLTAAKAESLVIAALTVSSEMCLRPKGESATILAPTIANYKKLAAKRWRLMRKFNLSEPYTLLEQRELDTYFGAGGSGWTGFDARYPKSGGFLFLSPVGFNSTKDIAVVEVNHSCGGLCGGGSFSVLQKKNGEWEDLNWNGSSCSWVS